MRNTAAQWTSKVQERSETDMICTCDNCHYTFQADALPASCPDCGKETVNRRMGGRVISSPAVRPASEAEIEWFEQAQKETAMERNADALREQMTIDEYNWSLVLQFRTKTPVTYEGRLALYHFLNAMREQPDRAAEIYPTIRREFTSMITKERGELKKAGFSENVMNPENDLPAVFGPALRTLYSFKPDKPGIPDFLQWPPNLGNIRRIDLEKIAREPSAAYTQFLLDWENSLLSDANDQED